MNTFIEQELALEWLICMVWEMHGREYFAVVRDFNTSTWPNLVIEVCA